MKKEEKKAFIRHCILGAIGGILMAAGDWLLGCVPLQETDSGLFSRACYLSGAYGLWKPPLAVGLGGIGCFFYFFMVKALNADIDARYVELINTTDGSFMTPQEAKHLMLCGSALLVGKK